MYLNEGYMEVKSCKELKGRKESIGCKELKCCKDLKGCMYVYECKNDANELFHSLTTIIM